CHRKAQCEPVFCGLQGKDTPCCVDKRCADIPAQDCPAGRCQLERRCDGELVCLEADSSSADCGVPGYVSESTRCCAGLQRRCGRLGGEGQCRLDTFPQCLACGDGTCEEGEDSCNCPEDCGEP